MREGLVGALSLGSSAVTGTEGMFVDRMSEWTLECHGAQVDTRGLVLSVLSSIPLCHRQAGAARI